MRQSRKPEQLNSFISSFGTASSPAVVAAPPPSRRRNQQQETLNMFAAPPASLTRSEGSEAAAAAVPPSASLTRSAAVRGETLNSFASAAAVPQSASLSRSAAVRGETLNSFASAAAVPQSASLSRSAAVRGETLNLFASASAPPPRRIVAPPLEAPPPLRPRVDAMVVDYGIDDEAMDDDDDIDEAPPPLRPRPAAPPPPPRAVAAPVSPPFNLSAALLSRPPLSPLSRALLSRPSRSPIQDFSDEIATLDRSILILFRSEVSLTPQQIFVNILPQPSNRLRIGYEDYVGSVLQFIFTNKIWRQFFTIKAADISQMVEDIMVTQNTLNDTQILLFIRIIKYILILYISSSTVESRDDDCLITWTDVAMTAYDVLCKHLMINIHSITVPPINSFETLLSSILDCIPYMLRPSVTTEDILRGVAHSTKFIKLPAAVTSLENYLRNVTVFREDYFVVFYENGQDIPVPEEFDFGALDYVSCPGTVTSRTGVVYRKLIHIDSRYSAEIASPTSPNGEVMFVTNRMGVVPREVGGGLKQSFFTALGYGPKTKKCDRLLNLIFAPGRSRLVVMYEKTTVQPQGRAMRAIDAANTLLAPVTGRRAAVATAAAATYGILDDLYNDPRLDFSHIV